MSTGTAQLLKLTEHNAVPVTLMDAELNGCIFENIGFIFSYIPQNVTCWSNHTDTFALVSINILTKRLLTNKFLLKSFLTTVNFRTLFNS